MLKRACVTHRFYEFGVNIGYLQVIYLKPAAPFRVNYYLSCHYLDHKGIIANEG